jgi:hypothetical protein
MWGMLRASEIRFIRFYKNFVGEYLGGLDSGRQLI